MQRPAVRAGLEVDPVNPWIAWRRKTRAMTTVTWRHGTVPRPEQLVSRAHELIRRTATEHSLERRVLALWQIEGLAFAAADSHFETISLRTLPLPLEAGPPAQCGLSMAAALNVGFEPIALTELLRERANPLFVDFAFESLGLMLAAWEPGLFGRTTAFLGSLRLLRRHGTEPAEPSGFLQQLELPERLLAAHGYGRLLYFRNHSLDSTFQAIRSRPFLPFGAAVRGAMAAYLLINSADSDRILEIVDSPLEPDLLDNVIGGLHNNLKLLEWSMPGCLSHLRAHSSSARHLLKGAVEEAKQRRERGEGPGMVP